MGPKRPYFPLNRSFLPDIAELGHIDPYTELYKYQVGYWDTSIDSLTL